MTLPLLASLDEAEQRLAEDVCNEVRLEACLADASALVRAEAGQDWVDTEGNLYAVPALIPSVAIAVALRLYRNPDGIRSEAVAGYSVSYQDASTGLWLTDEERRLVRRALGRTGVGTVELEGAWTTPADYVEVNLGGDPFPYPFTRPW